MGNRGKGRPRAIEILRPFRPSAIDYHVLEAEDGRQAISLLEARAGEISLVLSDLVMREVWGRALAERIREDYPHVRVMLMTGYPLRDDSEGIKDLAGVAWIQKPVDLGTLAVQVRRVLDA